MMTAAPALKPGLERFAPLAVVDCGNCVCVCHTGVCVTQVCVTQPLARPQVTLPGSPQAAAENMAALLPLLPRIVRLMRA